MAQPAPSGFPFITRECLLKDFQWMRGYGRDVNGRFYTHFVPETDLSKLIQITRNSNLKMRIYPIYACNCSQAMGREQRQLIEDKLCDKVTQLFNQKKLLTLYSFGSGDCYQELSVGVGLAKAGYDVRQIVLVDKKYEYEDQAVSEFSIFFKRLFPNAQVCVYQEETKYFQDIKSSKQEKPDVILCIDADLATNLPTRKETYTKMLESNSSQCILAYHNHVNLFNPNLVSEIEILQGSSA